VIRPGIKITLTASDGAGLDAVVLDRNFTRKHVWRATFVLEMADGLGKNVVQGLTSKSKTGVWR
jgi:hypothetical protein